MDPALEGYITQCRAAGMSNADILSALKTAGWSDEQLSAFTSSILPEPGPAATPVLTATPAATTTPTLGNDLSLPPKGQGIQSPAQPRISRVRKAVTVVALALIMLLLPTAAVIVAAENGYLPAVSRLYRRSALPLLWQGTNGNGALSIGRVLAASTDHETQKGTLIFAIKMTSTTGDGKTVLLPTKQLRFASFDSDVAQDELTAATNSDQPISYLPVDLAMTANIATDGIGGYDFGLTLDTKKLAEANPVFKDMLPVAVKDSLTFDMRAVATAKKVFFRSNLIPYEAGESGKWLSNPLTEKASTDLGEPKGITESLTQEDKDKLNELGKKVVTDYGIERRDGKPYAHYEVIVNQETVKTLQESDFFKEALKGVAMQDDALSDPLKVNIWVAPRTAKLHYMTVTATSVAQEIRTTIDVSYAMDFGGEVTITAPSSDEVLDQTLNDIVGSYFGTSSSTSDFTSPL